MRTALSKVQGVTDVAVNLDDKIARFKLDACCVPLQSVIKSVSAPGHNYQALLAFALPSVAKGKMDALEARLANVPGVLEVSPRPVERLLLIKLDLKKKTLFRDLTLAAKDVGVVLEPPPNK